MGGNFVEKCVDGSIKLSDRNKMTESEGDKVWSWGQLSSSSFKKKTEFTLYLISISFF